MRNRTKRRLKRGLLTGVEFAIIGFVVVLFAATWILVHAILATGHLSEARDDIARLRADLVAGRDPTLDLALAEADAHAAAHDTHDFVWSAASWLPPVERPNFTIVGAPP